MWIKHEPSKNTGTARMLKKEQFCGHFMAWQASFCKPNGLVERTDSRSGQVKRS